jgi:uncharacterized protein YndB with AHSA1/START domain
MSESDGSLRMTRVLPVPRTDTFRALTDPAQLARWWGPRGFTIPNIDFDPRVGGTYRIAMLPPEGDLFHLSGEFQEVEPPVRLAFTFRWEPPDPNDRETVATLSLEDLGSETEVLLIHGKFATAERRAIHEGGWSDSFERLAELLG